MTTPQETTMTTKQVVTYQNAYVPGTTSLCDGCQADDKVREALPALGPVSHGSHDGYCDGCDVTATTEQIRHGSFGPIVWAEDGTTRMATQEDMDNLPVGEDLTAEEEASIPEE